MKDPNSFDKVFAVAYKFEYNRQMVNEIADASWSGEWTFRTIDSIIKVSRLANTDSLHSFDFLPTRAEGVGRSLRFGGVILSSRRRLLRFQRTGLA